VVERTADAGLAFDGDGDRVVAVASDGSLLDGDHLLAICAVDRLERGVLHESTVVVTPMANLGLRRGLAARGIAVHEVPVGDRYILEAMESGNWVLGGEQSGHLVFRDLASTGDGILTGIQALDVARRAGQPLGDLAAQLVDRVPQVLVSVPVDRPGVEVTAEVADDVVVAAMELGDGGRILVRPSGTEPVVRVMVEAVDAALATAVADRLCVAVRRCDGHGSGDAGRL
jgi:phosphoglucosamine mutase